MLPFAELGSFDLSDNRFLTAEAGVDFIGFRNVVLDFAIGDTVETHTINLADGVDVNKQEYFEVCLSNPISGIVEPPECAIIYIEDDDCEYI